MISNSAPGLLIVVAPEAPWPANHGARVDTWNRWRMLRALGWQLVLVTWKRGDEVVSVEDEVTLREVFQCVQWLEKPYGPWSIVNRAVGLLRHSPHVWARRIDSDETAFLQAALQGQRPVAIVLDSLYGALAARKLAKYFKVPLFYRAHNVEHLYMPRQARAARTARRKLAIYLASLHLRRLEIEIHRQAFWVFDISQDDLLFWNKQGFARMSWLPPLLNFSILEAPVAWQDRRYDLIYVGNLNTPNNVAGLNWFFKQVLPPLLQYRPGLRLLVAGSQPSAEVSALVEQEDCATLLPNPVDVAKVRSQGRVLVNPVLAGSGVNVKSVEMLFTDSPIISTRIGVQGSSPEVQASFHVSDDPAQFAKLVDAALEEGPLLGESRVQVREQFGIEAARKLSMQLQTLLHSSEMGA